jgi:hypothetical protein
MYLPTPADDTLRCRKLGCGRDRAVWSRESKEAAELGSRMEAIRKLLV